MSTRTLVLYDSDGGSATLFFQDDEGASVCGELDEPVAVVGEDKKSPVLEFDRSRGLAAWVAALLVASHGARCLQEKGPPLDSAGDRLLHFGKVALRTVIVMPAKGHQIEMRSTGDIVITDGKDEQ